MGERWPLHIRYGAVRSSIFDYMIVVLAGTATEAGHAKVVFEHHVQYVIKHCCVCICMVVMIALAAT